MKYLPLLVILFPFALCAQTTTKPYRSVKDYEDAHPKPVYTRDRPKTSTTTSDYDDRPVDKSFESFFYIRDTPVTDEENRESLKMAEELLKLIKSASNNFQGYVGKYLANYGDICEAVNTDFLPSENKRIIFSQHRFYANIELSSTIKSVYLAVVKQIPILTSTTLKYKSTKGTFSGGHYHYRLYTDSGIEIVDLDISKYDFDLNIKRAATTEP